MSLVCGKCGSTRIEAGQTDSTLHCRACGNVNEPGIDARWPIKEIRVDARPAAALSQTGPQGYAGADSGPPRPPADSEAPLKGRPRGRNGGRKAAYPEDQRRQIGDRIRAIRRDLGLSQAVFGRMAGVPQSSILYMENGGYCNPDKLKRIATSTGVRVEWLKEGGEDVTFADATGRAALMLRAIAVGRAVGEKANRRALEVLVNTVKGPGMRPAKDRA